MDIMKRAQRGLQRNYANSPKAAVLMFLWGASCYGLDMIGIKDLASPWMALTISPVALIYLAERLGKIAWFAGMTLPMLLMISGSVALIWALNARGPVPDALTYGIFAGLISSMGFVMFRTWTYGPPA